ncbi:MAG: hypothetical protein IJS94_02365, partial [Clostridia bacterium]|nr:hypothetical protein [Clostridia bacterium]
MNNALKRTMKLAYKRIRSTVEANRNDSAASVWVLDNFYLIKKEFVQYKNIRKDLVYEDGFIYPRMYLALKRFLISSDYELNEKKLFSFLEKENSRLSLCFPELYSLPVLISAACTEEIGRICNTEEHVSKKRLSNAFTTLRRAHEIEAEDYMILSDAEKVLQKSEKQYSEMDAVTLYVYRNSLSKLAEGRRESEKECAERIASSARYKNCPLGRLLIPDNTSIKRRHYFILFGSLTVFFLSLAFLIFPVRSAVIILLPVMIELTFSVSDYLFTVTSAPSFTPRIDIKQIPEEHTVVVCITSLLFGKEEDEKLFENIERFYLLNRYGKDDTGIYYALLCDFPDGDREENDKEKAALENAADNIKKLNEKYGEKFCLMLRKWEDLSYDGKYMSHERKRGAVCSLVRYITEGDSAPFCALFGAYDKIRVGKYILTLDSDTVLCIDSVRELLGVMLHPMNEYGLVQPLIRTELSSASESRFTSVMTGAGGLELYESAAFDRYQSILGSGVFCGKGMFRVKDFYEKVINEIPDGVVLSHDMPEGNILNTRLVSQISLTDSMPKNALSYYKRLHRWIRGDIQNLSLIKKGFGGRSGTYKTVDNVRRHLTPVFAFLSLLSAPFVFDERHSVIFCLFALSYLLFPLFVCIISLPALIYKRGFKRRFFSQVTTSFKQTVYRIVYEISALPYVSYVTLDASVRSVYRLLFNRKKLLEWTTAVEADRKIKSGLFLHIKKMGFSVFSGAFLVCAGIITVNSFSCVAGTMWILFPFLAYAMSVEYKNQGSFSAYQKEKLRAHAKEMWRFFDENVSKKTNYLPPDNIQLSPAEA